MKANMFASKTGRLAMRFIAVIGCVCILCVGAKRYIVQRSERLLHIAVLNEWHTLASLLVRAGVKLESKNYDGRTPLHYAASMMDMPMMQLLLRHGADVNAKSIYGTTPLHLAVQRYGREKYEHERSLATVKFLIEQGAHVDEADEVGGTPLYDAIRGKHPAIVEYLIESGANISSKSKNENTYVLTAARWTDNVEIVRILLQHGADYTTCDESGRSPVEVAQVNKHMAVANFLRENTLDKGERCQPA